MKIFTAFACVVGLSACDSHLVEPLEEPRLGVLALYHQPVVVEVPDTVEAFVPFVVTLRTYGGGCERQGHVDVSRVHHVAVVTPFDFSKVGADLSCPDILYSFEHKATVLFEDRGSADIVVRGRRIPGDTLVVLHQNLWVR